MSALTQNQYQLLAEKLHARRDELLEDIMVRLREEDKPTADQLDAQLAEYDDDAVAEELISRELPYLAGELEKLRGVQKAEHRLQEGTYGECVECHRDINPDRLQMQPSVSRCSDCEQRSGGKSVGSKSYH